MDPTAEIAQEPEADTAKFEDYKENPESDNNSTQNISPTTLDVPLAERDQKEVLKDIADSVSESNTEELGEKLLEETQKNSRAMKAFLKAVQEVRKPEVALSLIAGAIGLAAVITKEPLSAELALATGGAAIGVGRGETATQKIKGATVGAVGGVAASQGISHAHVPGGDYVKAAMNFVDDAAVAAITLAKTATDSVKKIIERA